MGRYGRRGIGPKSRRNPPAVRPYNLHRATTRSKPNGGALGDHFPSGQDRCETHIPAARCFLLSHSPAEPQKLDAHHPLPCSQCFDETQTYIAACSYTEPMFKRNSTMRRSVPLCGHTTPGTQRLGTAQFSYVGPKPQRNPGRCRPTILRSRPGDIRRRAGG